jgi:predicted RNA binding protein YcfA (HicA-like mRNA interferase family)
MAFAPNIWNQIKNTTADEFKKALERDGFAMEGKSGAVLAFFKTGPPRRRITIHYHPKKTYGAKLLQGLIDDVGWTEDDLRRLKLIK